MKKYLKEKGKQALEWANVREDSNMNMQLQKLKLFRKQLKEIFKNGLLFFILVRKQVRR